MPPSKSLIRVGRILDSRLAQLKESSLDLSREPKTKISVMQPWRKQHLIRRLKRTIPSPSTLTSFNESYTSKHWSHETIDNRDTIRQKLSDKNKKHEGDLLRDSIEKSIEFSVALSKFCQLDETLLVKQDSLEKNNGSINSKLNEVRETYHGLQQSRQQAIELQLRQQEIYNTAIVKYPMANELMDFGKYQNCKLIDETSGEIEARRTNNEMRMLTDIDPNDGNEVDEDYEKFLKHHYILERLTGNQFTNDSDEHEREIEAWADSVWHRNYGNSDVHVPPSQIPCSGCGANLHCQDPGLPGFIPKQVFTSIVGEHEDECASDRERLSEKERYKLSQNNLRCQRCKFMDKYNVALKVSVPRENYTKVLAAIRCDPGAIVVLIVDLLDLPCSVWPGLLDVIGTSNRKIFVVANKVDLIPNDGGKDCIGRITECVKRNLTRLRWRNSEFRDNLNLSNVSVISAKTGFGVEQLVTRLLEASDKYQTDNHYEETWKKITENSSHIPNGLAIESERIMYDELSNPDKNTPEYYSYCESEQVKIGNAGNKIVDIDANQQLNDSKNDAIENDRRRRKETKIYLLGGTNVGKSTLFNALLQSDLCAERDRDLIARVATTSPWPGTTLSTLAFPMAQLRGWQLALRQRRLERVERNIKLLERQLINQRNFRNNMGHIQRLIERIEPTFKRQLPTAALDTMHQSHPFKAIYGPHKTLITSDSSNLTSPSIRDKNLHRNKLSPQGWVVDTPGTLTTEQIFDLFTHDELMHIMMRDATGFVPRTFTLRPLQTLFLGGVGRVDVLTCTKNIHLTVCASKYLPVHIVHTEHASRFYETFCGTQIMGTVPDATKCRSRLDSWPGLQTTPVKLKKSYESYNHNQNETDDISKASSNALEKVQMLDQKQSERQFYIRSTGPNVVAADIVLSSIGWVAVTLGPDQECILRAYTPGGRGIFRRDPPLLKYISRLRGRRIRGTPFFTMPDDGKHRTKIQTNSSEY